ncbi:MFS family permease [Polaromonas sp. CG_9.5]|nr:MFS family permease [Polaromonas sp. CG_9.5]
MKGSRATPFSRCDVEKLTPEAAQNLRAARYVIAAGVVAALHVGKLPPALPVLKEVLGISLLQAGFLLSLVQLAGMALGLFTGLAAQRIGLKRSMAAGLLILASASALGGMAQSATWLLATRVLEGLGFLWIVLPAPGLVRRLVPPERLHGMLGVWVPTCHWARRWPCWPARGSCIWARPTGVVERGGGFFPGWRSCWRCFWRASFRRIRQGRWHQPGRGKAAKIHRIKNCSA